MKPGNLNTGAALSSAVQRIDEGKKETIGYLEALVKAEASAPPVKSEKPQVDPLTHKVISSDDGQHHSVVAHPISMGQMQYMASKAPPAPPIDAPRSNSSKERER